MSYVRTDVRLHSRRPGDLSEAAVELVGGDYVLIRLDEKQHLAVFYPPAEVAAWLRGLADQVEAHRPRRSLSDSFAAADIDAVVTG